MESNTSAMAATSGIGSAGGAKHSNLSIDIQELDHSGSSQFRAALDRYMGGGAHGAQGGAAKADDSNSLGKVIASKATGLATEVKKDQQYVSKMLEQATRTGDSLQLMRAMMALNDYQLRAQTISKTVSKAATSIDSLTKLQ